MLFSFSHLAPGSTPALAQSRRPATAARAHPDALVMHGHAPSSPTSLASSPVTTPQSHTFPSLVHCLQPATSTQEAPPLLTPLCLPQQSAALAKPTSPFTTFVFEPLATSSSSH